MTRVPRSRDIEERANTLFGPKLAELQEKIDLLERKITILEFSISEKKEAADAIQERREESPSQERGQVEGETSV